MLKQLSINNYLLIDEIKLDFEAGFSVITGETGAGKSIILGAISLLLGKRADTDVLLEKSKKCIVEGSFVINENIKDLFLKADIDYDKNTIIRREILPEGKSRAFINDTPVNLSTLKSIAEKITDLHSQHENLALSLAEYRIAIIDTAAKTKDEFHKYQQEYLNLKNLQDQLKNAEQELSNAQKDLDYYTFQAEQLEKANLIDDNELIELEAQSAMLENAEEIKLILEQSTNLIDNNEVSIDAMLRELKNGLNKITNSYNNANEIIDRIDSVIIELKDINHQLSADSEKAEINPSLLEIINARIDLLNTLLTKHQANNIAELKLKYLEYSALISNTIDIENKIQALNKSVEVQNSICIKIAKELSEKRTSIFIKTQEYIIGQLQQLGMPHAIFEIHNNKHPHLTENGFDNIEFKFSANKSVKPQPLDKVASGGEFSRLMLTMKSLLVNASGVSTVIFDEIDTGVSGEIASKMGKIMQKIAGNTQVISISHLAQVAALGQNHFKVYKIIENDRTQTRITKLSNEERVHEIAAMISGEKMTNQAIENAKILLGNTCN
ncbi:MAG: DNA repair protein RecN [Bacteroidales bacterium]|nr:DNA repair protein RecN [Bacteroidales bacterium]